MEKFKLIVKKYFLLLIGGYLSIALLTALIMMYFPEVLSYQVSESTYGSLSKDHLFRILEYLLSILFVFFIQKELRQFGVKSVPILIVTFLSIKTGVILFLILLFYADYKKGELANEIIP